MTTLTLSLIAVLALSGAQASTGVAGVSTGTNVTLQHFSAGKCYDFDGQQELSTPNSECDLYLTGTCMESSVGCSYSIMFNFNASTNGSAGVMGIGPNIDLDHIWQLPEAGGSHARYQANFPFYQEQDGLALITSNGNYVAFIAYDADETADTVQIDYKIQTNGSNTLGVRPTTGCASYDSEQTCREAANTGDQCFWDFGMSLCRQDEGGGPGPGPGGEGGMGGTGCWLFDGNQTLCESSNNCIWCTDNSTAGCEDIMAGEAAICEPAVGADEQIQCANITVQSVCGNMTMLSSCCEWNATGSACQATFDSSCRQLNQLEPGKAFCQDYLAADNQTICNQLAGFPYLMPCEWNNETSKCEFRDDKMFDGGEGGFDDIGSEQNCVAAGGTWKTETFKYTDSYGTEKTDTDEWCEMGFGGTAQTCANDCWACEYQPGRAGDPNGRWGANEIANATAACEGSDLGFCYWETVGGENSPSANEGGPPGWCFPMQEISFGGGNCDTNCFDCFAPTINKSKERCEASNNGCKWFWEDSTNTTGWCDNNNVMGCDQDCFQCYDQDSCENQGLGGGGECQWDVNFICKPEGFSGEICFDGADNDNDGDTDCADSDCTYDSFCGGDYGSDCGQYQDSQSQCNATEGCAWINDPFCETCFFCGREEEQCFVASGNQTACEAQTDVCNWIPQPNCDVNKTLSQTCYNNTLNETTCNAISICSWKRQEGPGFAPPADGQPPSGFCDFKMWDCNQQTDQASCQALNVTGTPICAWMDDPFMGGRCDAACFSFNMFGGASNTCETETGGLCELTGGFCEPQTFAKQEDCFRWKNETSCNLYNESCGWMAAPGGAGCDINESLMQTTCGPITDEASCNAAAASGCAWTKFEMMGGPDGEFAPGEDGFQTLGDGFCGLGVFKCFSNATLNQNESACEADSNCAWMFNHCEPKCFTAAADECSVQCMPVEGYCQPQMMLEMFGSMEGGPPVDLASDDCGSGSGDVNISDYVDMCFLGIKDNKNSFGFGVGVDAIGSAAICNEFSQGQQSTEFYWYLDTDGNETNNCNSTDGNQTGFEFKFKYIGQISNTTQNLSEVRVAYKCVANTTWVATQVKLSTYTRKMCQDLEGAMVAVDKSDLKKFPALYNATQPMRIYATSADNTTNETTPADTVGPGWYRPGTADFKFEDCNAPGQDLDGDGYTSENDPDCTDVKRKGYVDFEDCFPDGIDNDGNGLIDCEEPHCADTPACSNDSFSFEADPNDKLAPRLIRYTVDKYHDMAIVKYDSDEPANGTLDFYGNISGCTTLNRSTDDVGDASMAWDDYKPWHSGQITGLTANTTYYFKLRLWDPSGNPSASGCLNFTTKANASNITLGMIYTASAGAVLTENVSAYVADNDSTDYAAWDYTYGHRTVRILDGKLKFDSPNASTYWSVELLGIDVLRSMTINMTGAFIENQTGNASGNYTYIGLEGGNWQNVLQNLGVESVRLTLPKPGNISCYNMTINHCADNATACSDVGNVTLELAGCNSTHTVWQIPITLGFSTYSVTGGGFGGAAVVSISMDQGWSLISVPLLI